MSRQGPRSDTSGWLKVFLDAEKKSPIPINPAFATKTSRIFAQAVKNGKQEVVIHTETATFGVYMEWLYFGTINFDEWKSEDQLFRLLHMAKVIQDATFYEKVKAQHTITFGRRKAGPATESQAYPISTSMSRKMVHTRSCACLKVYVGPERRLFRISASRAGETANIFKNIGEVASCPDEDADAFAVYATWPYTKTVEFDYFWGSDDQLMRLCKLGLSIGDSDFFWDVKRHQKKVDERIDARRRALWAPYATEDQSCLNNPGCGLQHRHFRMGGVVYSNDAIKKGVKACGGDVDPGAFERFKEKSAMLMMQNEPSCPLP